MSGVERRELTRIDLNELTTWSPWPRRLLGLEPWTVPVRDIAKIDQEYDKDKWARCLTYLTEHPATTPRDLFRQLARIPPDVVIPVSLGDELFAMPWSDALARHEAMLLDTLLPLVEKAGSAIELGCGFGHNVWLLSQHVNTTLVGGDYSANAVETAQRLFSADIRVLQFNFYDDSYDDLSRPLFRIVTATTCSNTECPTSAIGIVPLNALGNPWEFAES